MTHDEIAAQYVRDIQQLRVEREMFRDAFLNLYAVMKGECPGLLDSDRDGDMHTDELNSDALELDAKLKAADATPPSA